jgi:hypothetical protein
MSSRRIGAPDFDRKTLSSVWESIDEFLIMIGCSTDISHLDTAAEWWPNERTFKEHESP